MIREAVLEDLHGLLELYLHLHETEIPEDSFYLQILFYSVKLTTHVLFYISTNIYEQYWHIHFLV